MVVIVYYSDIPDRCSNQGFSGFGSMVQGLGLGFGGLVFTALGFGCRVWGLGDNRGSEVPVCFKRVILLTLCAGCGNGLA